MSLAYGSRCACSTVIASSRCQRSGRQQRIDTEAFEACFRRWVASVVETVHRADAIYCWFFYDTESQAAAGYVNASGDNGVNATDVCGMIYR